MYANRATLRPIGFWNGGGNYALSYALDGSTKKWSVPFVWPESFTLAKVALFLDKAGTCPTYAVRVETDDGTGNPSGTLAWASASATFSLAAGGYTSELSLTASGAGTAGALYHVVVQHSSGTVDGSNFLYCMENGQVLDGQVTGMPVRNSRRYNGASWSGGSGVGTFVLVDDGGTPTRWGQVLSTSTLPTVTDTDWYGVKFVCPATLTAFGVGCSALTNSSAGTVSAKLIDATNTVIASADAPPGWWDLGGRAHHLAWHFPFPIGLAAGATYRLVWKDTLGAHRLDMPTVSPTYKALTPDGGNSFLTYGVSIDGTASPTSWTDTDTSIPDWSLLVSAVTLGGGATGSRGRLVNAGG